MTAAHCRGPQRADKEWSTLSAGMPASPRLLTQRPGRHNTTSRGRRNRSHIAFSAPLTRRRARHTVCRRPRFLRPRHSAACRATSIAISARRRPLRSHAVPAEHSGRVLRGSTLQSRAANLRWPGPGPAEWGPADVWPTQRRHESARLRRGGLNSLARSVNSVKLSPQHE